MFAYYTKIRQIIQGIKKGTEVCCPLCLYLLFTPIDCMPSLGMITLNALTAADSVIIPVQAQYLPAKGMTQLLSTIAKVKKHTNRNLTIDGILLTLVDGRTNLAKSTVSTAFRPAGESTSGRT